MTATAFTSVSLEPPTVLVCINQSVTSAEAIRNNGRFAINLLRADQAEYSNRFASPLPPAERFEGIAWHEGTAGIPLLDGSLATLECRLTEQVHSGTHWIFIAEVERVHSDDGAPLVYFDGGYANLDAGDG
jgi:flavin reductase (DIM6/NTAB) family NADH-FMN oxidoreductase RutF